MRKWMRWMTGCSLLAGLMVVPSTASAGEPQGLELGLRFGYAFPLGSASGSGGGSTSVDQSAIFSGAVPIWIDAGYRFPHLYIGGFFQYGVGLLNTGSSGVLASTCSASGVSCSGSVVMLGADVAYHILPSASFDPWIGGGIGYEIANASASEGSVSVSESFSGFQFLNLQAGADYKVLGNLGIGPFAMMSFAEYTSCSVSGSDSGTCSIPNKALHEWLTIGIRGAFDINL